MVERLRRLREWPLAGSGGSGGPWQRLRLCTKATVVLPRGLWRRPRRPPREKWPLAALGASAAAFGGAASAGVLWRPPRGARQGDRWGREGKGREGKGRRANLEPGECVRMQTWGRSQTFSKLVFLSSERASQECPKCRSAEASQPDGLSQPYKP